MVKVSVLMPVYKTDEKFLREAIDSILNQSFKDFEFLILDDCPEDPREEIVGSYKDNRIRYFKNEKNMGITPSRNKLIDWAQGEYLAVFDHDDISLPHRLERQVDFLDKHPDYGVVGTKFKTMKRGEIITNPTDDHDIKVALMQNCAITHSSAMIRKTVLIDHKLRYEESFSPAEDYALWNRLIKYTKFYNLNDEVFLYYRDHQNNTSHKQAKEMQEATIAIWSFTRNDNPALYEEFLLKGMHKTYIRLFGFIPLLYIYRELDRTKGYLFGKLLLWSSRSCIKAQGIKNERHTSRWWLR